MDKGNSKRDAFTNNGFDTFNDLLSGASSVKEDNKDINKNVIKGISKAIDPIINGYKYKNGANRQDNFITTFKVDADLERYLINIANITLIDAVNNENADYCTTIQDYLNNLIRADLKKRFKIPPKETDSQQWIKVLNDYCNKYNLEDVKPINKK
jgi:hypothetical protein